MAKIFLMAASISGFLAVAIGAFGAHGLKQKISEEMMAVYQTGVQYHFYHTLALLGVGILLQQFPHSLALKVSGWGMLLGMLVFSGSLYLLALSGTRWLGAITPIGGLALLVAWLALAVGINQSVGR
jgi:uncharacterized membrane protein YgdD (TMEM256/DUF423 family)